MSGHSKWATTKHRKAAQDAKRSALFSKLSRNITVAAKEGGDPNPDNNASLAAAIDKAKSYSLPKDKIKTAIDKAFGTGKDAANYESVVYEGYGPAGGMIANGAAGDEDEFMMVVAEAGGDDYEDADEEWIVYTAPNDLMAVKKAIEEQGVATKGAEFIMEPTTPTQVSVSDAKKVMRLIDKLEELEDLQNVYHTMEITDEIAAALDEQSAFSRSLFARQYSVSCERFLRVYLWKPFPFMAAPP